MTSMPNPDRPIPTAITGPAFLNRLSDGSMALRIKRAGQILIL
jgi:hypothetical protein